MTDSHPYSHRVVARFADTDAEEHVYSGSYFVYCDEALMGLIAAAGYGWDLLALESKAFYYVESGCRYLKPVRFSESMRVGTRLTKLGKSSLRAEMDIERESDGEQVATGFLVAVLVDKRTATSIPIPTGMREALQRFRRA